MVCIAGPSFKKTIGVGLEKGDLLWTSNLESPHPFFFKDVLYVVPRVASPAPPAGKSNRSPARCSTNSVLGVIGSCTRLTVTPNQFFYRPGGGEGRTVYVDIGARKLADYEGVVRPGCFDGVVPANGRLYWMPLACDCWQVHGTFSMAPRSVLKEPIAPPGAARMGGARLDVRRPPTTTGRCSEPTPPGRPRFPPPLPKTPRNCGGSDCRAAA